MQNISPIYFVDSYKIDHRRQYPANTTLVYSNMTPRSAKYLKYDKVYCFGLQYFIKEYLIRQFNTNFFQQPLEYVVDRYQKLINHHLGPNSIGTEHIAALHSLGYLPIKIKAVPEGETVSINQPLLTITNTKPEFFWLTNYLETLMSCVLWMPCTNATSAKMFRDGLDKYAAETCEDNNLVDFQGHDFSFRGMSSLESALVSGAAHLIHFKGTDCVPALEFIYEYYGKEYPAGHSVSATEHSVTCMSLADQGEFQFFKRLITELYPKGILSLVSDTWDYWQVLGKYLPELKEDIIQRWKNNPDVYSKVVIRPDSGDPNFIINGDPNGKTIAEREGTLNILANVFGTSTNSKGYKELHPAIGVIYGDGINLQRQEEILSNMKKNGFASNNIVFGVGSFHYQYQTRDAFGMAVKATYGQTEEDGAVAAPAYKDGREKNFKSGKLIKGHNIFKDPKTDSDNMKKSHKGLLSITDSGELLQECSWEQESSGRLKTVFEDGILVRELTWAQIRKNAGY